MNDFLCVFHLSLIYFKYHDIINRVTHVLWIVWMTSVPLDSITYEGETINVLNACCHLLNLNKLNPSLLSYREGKESMCMRAGEMVSQL